MESVILIYSTVKMIELKNCNDIRKFNFNVFYFETYTLEWAEYVSSPQASHSRFSPHAWLCGKTKLMLLHYTIHYIKQLPRSFLSSCSHG